MIEGMALAFVAGVLTLLSPCVLPLLPVVVLGSWQAGRWGPVALGLGLAVSFALFGTLVAAFGRVVGLSPDVLRAVGALLLIAAGVILLLPPAQAILATAAGPLVSGAGTLGARLPGDGLLGQAAIGALLGMVWAPCVGPTLGAAIGAAAQGRDLVSATLIMLAFGFGTGGALVAFAQGTREAVVGRRRQWGDLAARAKPVFAVVLVVVGLVILTGLDRRVEASLLNVMPDWLVTLTTRF